MLSLKKNFFLIFLLFFSLLYFLFLPFPEDLVSFGISLIADKSGGFSFLNNVMYGKLIAYKYILYFLNIFSSNYQENINLYQIIFRGSYAFILIILGYVYSKIFCNYKNIKGEAHDSYIIFSFLRKVATL